jgi:hypothetical protein
MAISVAPLERGDDEDTKEEEELSRSGRLREEVVGVEDFQMPLIPYTSTPNSNGNGLQRKVLPQQCFFLIVGEPQKLSR